MYYPFYVKPINLRYLLSAFKPYLYIYKIK